ncbi:MAG TPA: J domain-containing protein [Rubrobacteraceae bacterium]|nr:J domain-containing protein [Rubrobacteraceae bacterium]
MSIPRRLGRLARGFVSNINDDRLRETVRVGRERGETLKDALGAAWRGAAEEWRSAAEERAFEEQNRATAERSAGRTRERWSEARWTASSPRFTPRQYPPHVLAAYHRLGLGAGSSLDEANRKRRELVKRYHPDRFAEPGQRARAERLTAEINAAHDAIERYLLRR